MPLVEVPDIKEEKKVTLNSRETALIVVDMQKDFVYLDGKLCVPTAKNTILNIRYLIQLFRSKKSPIFFTMDTHREGDPEFPIWGEHVIEGTRGWEIIDELEPTKEDFIIRKTRYDAFFGTPLDEYLRILGVKNVVITGTVANICVLHTAGSAALRFYRVIIPKDAISALNEFDFYTTLRQVSFLYRGVITESKEIELV